ncbi:MAG: hypothetical protein GY943_05005 [Chloroflexi bacterium]|nr:hypothetical protein [Chloroflexota bacterium]
MTKQKILLVVGLLFSSLFIVSLVSADTISGTGWLTAHGNGEAVIMGDFRAMHITGNGVLLFKDLGETDTPIVTGYGRKIELDNGWTKYVGFHGTFHLTNADNVIVRLEGRDIHMHLVGSGEVWLRGEGHYRYGSHDGGIEGNWQADGTSIDVAPVE